MATLASSKFGNAKWNGGDIPDVRGWTLNMTDDVQPYASSATAGHRSRVSGIRDATATVTFYQAAGDDIEGILREGDAATLLLYENGTRFWTVPAIVISIDMNTPIEEGQINQGTIQFGATAAITPPT